MEYKYSTINEVNHFEFGEAVVGDIQLTERMFHLVLDNVKICPENSCNRDIRMMRTNELLFKISDAEIISLVEEGYNEYDADGNLKHTYPDEEVEKAKYDEVAQVLLEGTIYELTLQSGVYTFIIDGTNDRTYALKVPRPDAAIRRRGSGFLRYRGGKAFVRRVAFVQKHRRKKT